MDALSTIICFLLMVLETLIGMAANGSIVLINFIDWFGRRKLSATDLILTCLALSRLLMQALLIVDLTLYILLNITQNAVLFTMMGIWIFTNAVNLWFAACLSVFYLAKIAIFSHPVFLQVKQRISRLVPRLLLASVAFSAVLTIIVTPIWIHDLTNCNPYKSLSSNRSNAEMNMPHTCRHYFVLMIAFDCVPFMVFLSSSVFLISSLWKHVRSVQSSGTGARDLNTQAHLSAIKALVSFAVLYLICFAAFTSLSVLVWTNKNIWTAMSYNLSALYPSGHSIILILINPKLKQAWVSMIQHFKCGSRIN